ncbi:tripartite tricarboxylate transporter TctB family protein [Vineibacter terrae]|uniref:Tripartite tricarboxylate transporter TctB family protein n=1 Tax=Vineibacter terrae TaxID=2586908 RepID=A0A5C8PC07_9HYPH|nr:tripartite tricarboxylate transporter TctB family protein [Vineibacter terrae]TXL71239.1 tripartite tricarboxylate transporter TctB family protein [Vineibacter terrae]
MSRMTGARSATLGLLAVALIGFWQATRLESWSFDGPGAGFFPQLVAGLCIALALVVLVAPGRPGATEAGDTDADGTGAEDADAKDTGAEDTNRADAAVAARSRRTFALYAASFVVLALGAAYAGFALTVIAVAILIVRFAEGRSWFAAIGYGLACALIGLVCFGWLLRVDLPESAIERAFYALVR